VSTPAELSVVMALTDQANEDGVCWPSVGTISRGTRLGDRTVQVALRRLAADHHISITGRVGGGYGLHTPTYVVHPVPTEKPQGEPDLPRTTFTGEPHSPVNVETRGVNVETQWGEPEDTMG
jgi:hypothetical protein